MNNEDPQVTERTLNDDPTDAVPADGYTLDQCVQSIIDKSYLEMYLQAGGEIH